MESGPTSSPRMAATRRPSTSYVLASLRALHVDLLLAGGKAGNDRGRAICAQASIGWGQNSPNLDPLHVGGANTRRQVGPIVTRRATVRWLARPARPQHDQAAVPEPW
jgi:hypothetical protein